MNNETKIKELLGRKYELTELSNNLGKMNTYKLSEEQKKESYIEYYYVICQINAIDKEIAGLS